MIVTSIPRTVLRQGRIILKKNFSTADMYFSGSKNSTQTFDPKILDIIVCPLSKTPLKFDPEKNELICEKLQVAYSIVDGIPNLIPQDARIINNSED